MGNAYTVQVLRHDGCFHCHISLPQGDDQKVKKKLSMGGCDYLSWSWYRGDPKYTHFIFPQCGYRGMIRVESD